MEPTQEQLDAYAQTLCNLKTISDFLSTVKCNPDGTFTVTTNDGCCYNTKKIPTEELLAIINTAQTQELIDAINDLDLSIDGGIQVADLQPLIDAAECICETLRDDILPLLEPGFTSINDSLTNIINNTAPLENTFTEISNNTTPLSNIETLLNDLLTDLQEPYVVDYIPITEYIITPFAPGEPYPGLYPITDFNSIPAYNQEPAAGNVIQYTGNFVLPEAPADQYNLTLEREITFLVTNISGCNQTMIKAWSDGTFTDLNDNPIDITTVQDNAGWCRSGIVPTAWNTEYTQIS